MDKWDLIVLGVGVGVAAGRRKGDRGRCFLQGRNGNPHLITGTYSHRVGRNEFGNWWEIGVLGG